MKRLAYALIAVGVLVALIAFNLDVTVENSGFANMNMMAQRQNLLIIGCVGFLGGLILLVGSIQRNGTAAHQLTKTEGAASVDGASTNGSVAAFWREKDIGRKLILISAPLILTSFCIPWRVSSMHGESWSLALSGTPVEFKHVVIAILLWVYPMLVSTKKIKVERVNAEGLNFNSVVAIIWISVVAYGTYDFSEALAEMHIQIGFGFGFWLALIAVFALTCGVFKIERFVPSSEETIRPEIQ